MCGCYEKILLPEQMSERAGKYRAYILPGYAPFSLFFFWGTFSCCFWSSDFFFIYLFCYFIHLSVRYSTCIGKVNTISSCFDYCFFLFKHWNIYLCFSFGISKTKLQSALNKPQSLKQATVIRKQVTVLKKHVTILKKNYSPHKPSYSPHKTMLQSLENKLQST